ncbi:probable inactive receptor kinase At5g67200 [Aristolochia californica]|uniref:probable inactive receptor kinase At5g67200 n=1 Tax=Aristolochia californica TaxID=171875 RepID=UPI0035E0108F
MPGVKTHFCSSFPAVVFLVLVHLPLQTPATKPRPSEDLSLPHDAVALIAFKSSADEGRRLNFSVSASLDYCWWEGVKCVKGKVVHLVLESSGLKGRFAGNTLTRLDQLRVLSLKNNSLSGPVPDLSALLNLKSLFLDHNSFEGSFPLSIVSLHRLRTLDLSRNAFDGPIPDQLAGLDRLYYLRLELNRFNGTIPAFNQSFLRVFNVSGNNLTGAVPATAALLRFDLSAFAGNIGLCGEVLHKHCETHVPFFSSSMVPQPAQGLDAQNQGILLSPPPKKKHIRTAAIVGLTAGILLVAAFLVGFSLLIKKTYKRKITRISSPTAASALAPRHIEEEEEPTLPAAPKASNKSLEKLQMAKSGNLIFCAGESQVYTLEQLMKASAELLGRGTTGTTYKAVLDNQLIVSVKRLDAGLLSGLSKEVFERHMGIVGNLRHPNLVPLRAYFQAKDERILVYDYQPNGSLYSLIHGSRSARAKPLHWTSCLKIAEDVAQGLAYIHQASRLVHGNIKSSNVLLGAEFEACLTDYCVSVLIEVDDETGYRAPETRKSSKRATPKSDVFSFGLLLLELLTGRLPFQQPFLTAADLPNWVRSVREDDSEDTRLLMLLDIAIACIQASQEQRPTTWQILKMIQEIKDSELGDIMGSTGFI